MPNEKISYVQSTFNPTLKINTNGGSHGSDMSGDLVQVNSKR